MDRKQFEHEMRRAQSMQKVSNSEYWIGYQRGLRRRYHGEKFGTKEEHKLWLSLYQDSYQIRHNRGLGYRDGYYYPYQLTTEHSASSYGMPVFVDCENNSLDYADGIQVVRRIFDFSVKDLANKCGVSPRTVEGWEQGRLPSKSVLLLIQSFL